MSGLSAVYFMPGKAIKTATLSSGGSMEKCRHSALWKSDVWVEVSQLAGDVQPVKL